MKPLNLVFISVGGHGTVLPLLTICKGLALKDHSVCIVAHYIYKQLAEANNIRFEAISEDTSYRKGVDNKPLTFSRYSHLFGIKYSAAWNARIFEILKGACPSRPIILSVDRDNLWADFAINATSQTPVVRLQLDLPFIGSQNASAALPTTRLQEATGQRLALAWQRESARIGERVGGSQLFRIQRAGHERTRQLALWPRWITGKYPYAARIDHHIGFVAPLCDPLSVQLQSWLDSLSRPLILFVSGTVGTTRTWHRHFLEESLRACEEMGWAGLLLGGSGESNEIPLPAFFRWECFAPIDHLLPRAKAIVHHGGIGTAAAAMRHSIPQVIVPRVFGQLSNAEWMRRAGIAVVLTPLEYKSRILLAAFDQRLNRLPSVGYYGRISGRTSLDRQLQAIEEYLSGIT